MDIKSSSHNWSKNEKKAKKEGGNNRWKYQLSTFILSYSVLRDSLRGIVVGGRK